MNTIRHRLYVKTASVEDAEGITALLTEGGRFSFQNAVSHPKRESDDRAWNLANWGTEFDCIHALVRRPSTPDAFTLEFVTEGRFPRKAAEALREKIGPALVAWMVSLSGEHRTPKGAESIAAAGFPGRDLVQNVWHTLDIGTLTVADWDVGTADETLALESGLAAVPKTIWAVTAMGDGAEGVADAVGRLPPEDVYELLRRGTWLVKFAGSAEALCSALGITREKGAENPAVFVTAAENSWGFAPKELWAWIDEERRKLPRR